MSHDRAPVRHHREEYEQGIRNPTADIFSVERPWGDFRQFVSNETVTVKIITVEPSHRLSLQRHNHRGEMWHVLDVPIDVEVDDQRWTADVGDTVWVPRGATHRMGNSGTVAGVCSRSGSASSTKPTSSGLKTTMPARTTSLRPSSGRG